MPAGFTTLRRNHDFTVLWVAQTASELGTRVSLFVVPLLAYALTRSTLVAGLAGGVDLLGTALGLLPGGLLADRVDRRLLLRGGAATGTRWCTPRWPSPAPWVRSPWRTWWPPPCSPDSSRG